MVKRNSVTSIINNIKGYNFALLFTFSKRYTFEICTLEIVNFPSYPSAR